MTSFFNVIFYLSRAKSLSKLYATIFSYTKYIRENTFYVHVFWIVIGQTLLLFLFWMVYFTIFFYNNSVFLMETKIILSYMATFVLIYLLTLINFQNSNLLQFLKKILSCLNSDLSALGRRKIFEFREMCGTYGSVILENRKNEEKADLNKLKNLESWIVAYGEFCETSELVNSIFGGCAAARACLTFVLLTLTIYILIMTGKDVFITMVSLSLFVAEQLFLIISCESIVNEVNLSTYIFSTQEHTATLKML